MNHSAAGSRAAPLKMTRRAVIGGMIAVAAVPSLLQRAWADPAGTTPLSLGAGAPVPRQHHTLTALLDGRLLIAGGFYLGPLSSVQIFDPNTGVWADAAPLLIPRYQHAAALLSDGRVLVTGGIYRGVLTSTEVYDPGTNTWSSAAPLNTPRHLHAAAALADGSVFVMGGLYRGALSSVERFDGATWTLRS